jgi:Ca-activated chloride channel homolog
VHGSTNGARIRVPSITTTSARTAAPQERVMPQSLAVRVVRRRRLPFAMISGLLIASTFVGACSVKQSPTASTEQTSSKEESTLGRDPNAPIAFDGDDEKGGGTAKKHKGAEGAMGDPAGYGAIGSLQGNKPPGTPFASATTTAIAKPPAPGALDPMPNVEPAAILDPNGRYATTYRPGAGHLAAFEAAIAKGVVPLAERSIVSDVGARYTPDFALKSGSILGVNAELERGSLPPSGGLVHLRVALHSAELGAGVAKTRPHLSVHLVLDVSGSMSGTAMENAKSAAAAMVDKLDAGDDFSLVTFADSAQLLVADGPVGSRRADIKTKISGIATLGGTNIGAGLQLGYQQAQTKGIPEDAMRVVLLLSDGQPTAGIRDPKELAHLALDSFQKGVQTSSFGLGDSYDGALMSAIADEGAGGYYYLKDSTTIAPALVTELDKRLDPIATAVEVRIRLKKDVDVMRVYGSRKLTAAEAEDIRKQEVATDDQAKKKLGIDKDRENDPQGGMRFFIPAFAANDGHSLLLQLKVPAGVGKKDLAMVELKYKDVVHKKNVVEEIPLSALFADSDATSATTVNASVQKTVQGFAAGDALVLSAMKLAANDRAGAVAVLAEREALLRTAATMLKEPAFLEEADRLKRLEEHATGGGPMADSMLLAMVLETAGHARLR